MEFEERMESTGEKKGLTTVEWLICVVASIGFAFDIYELLMLPLVLPGALAELGQVQLGSPEFARWRDLMFYAPAIAGGIFGLLGGYLTDRLGRRRVLVWSILLYALSAFGAGFATSLPMLLALRCLTFVGVCVEFVAAVAWLAELFPDPQRREKVLGYTQAFSSLGGLMVSGVFTWLSHHGAELPAIQGSHEPWRYTLISGLIPAIPLILIRPFLPESPEWARKKAEGTLKRASLGEIFAPAYRRTTLVTTLMFACAYGAAFGAIQHLPQIVPGLRCKPPWARCSSSRRRAVCSGVSCSPTSRWSWSPAGP
jgi:MFS family permease